MKMFACIPYYQITFVCNWISQHASYILFVKHYLGHNLYLLALYRTDSHGTIHIKLPSEYSRLSSTFHAWLHAKRSLSVSFRHIKRCSDYLYVYVGHVHINCRKVSGFRLYRLIISLCIATGRRNSYNRNILVTRGKHDKYDEQEFPDESMKRTSYCTW
jgi:hypothetical protein